MVHVFDPEWIELAIVATALAYLMWMQKRNTDKLDSMVKDIVEIKTSTSTVRDDHDNIVRLQEHTGKHARDIHEAHKKIRSIANG